MTARQVYEGTLIELNKIQAPSMLLEDFNYFINKAVNQYINKKYNIYDINQQSTDDLRVLKATAIIPVTATGAYGSNSAGNVTAKNSLYAGTYEADLPTDYLHLLNCVCNYEVKKQFKCYDNGTYVQFGATRLTADLWSQIINNFYMKPSYKRPYYYLHHVNTSTTNSIPTNPWQIGSNLGKGTDVTSTANRLLIDISTAITSLQRDINDCIAQNHAYTDYTITVNKNLSDSTAIDVTISYLYCGKNLQYNDGPQSSWYVKDSQGSLVPKPQFDANGDGQFDKTMNAPDPNFDLHYNSIKDISTFTLTFYFVPDNSGTTRTLSFDSGHTKAWDDYNNIGRWEDGINSYSSNRPSSDKVHFDLEYNQVGGYFTQVKPNYSSTTSGLPRSISLPGGAAVDMVEREAGVRFGNQSQVRIEVRTGKDTSIFELKELYIDYIKAPQHIRLTQEQIDLTEDTSQMMEFPDYVCQEIINELTHLIMENSSDPRLQSHMPITMSIANPAAQQQQPQQQTSNQ